MLSRRNRSIPVVTLLAVLAAASLDAAAARREDEMTYPPALPGGQKVVTDTSPDFLKPPATLREGVEVAKEPPTIDFLYYPGQTYAGKPWSNWGDSLAANGKYYASIGDHLAPAGNAFVYEYDPAAKDFRLLLDVRKLLNLPDGHYTPGKIHGRLDLGSDGMLYCATHRGSSKATTDEFHYKGDWIIRVDPKTGGAEVVVHAPVPRHCIPNHTLDPQRLIFYGGTAPGHGEVEKDIRFFAYDVRHKKLLYDGPDGPGRYMILAKSTGRVYYTPGLRTGPLMRYDPAGGEGAKPVQIPGTIGIRAATQETPLGFVYSVSQGKGGAVSMLYALNTKTEATQELGPIAVGTQQYVASIDADPTGRYLYYVPGAHGGGENDGSPLVQYDVQTKRKKVIAFLHPFYRDQYGATPKGTYSTAVDETGGKVYVTWNVSRGSRAWDCCALTVIHVPESERRP